MMKLYKGFKIHAYQTADYLYKYSVSHKGFYDKSIITFCDESLAIEECMREIDGGLFDELYNQFVETNHGDERKSLEIV